MLILFNKYVNTIIYLFIYIVSTWLVVVLPPFRWWIPDGWWCIPGGWWCDPRWLVVPPWWLVVPPWWQVVPPWWLVVHPGILGRILQPGTQAGASAHPSVRRRSRLNGSLSGFFLIGYYSIFQLFKFSYRMLHAKVFSGENLIKTLFSIDYRGYFIIQATHSTINYSYFLHKTDRKHVKNQ